MKKAFTIIETLVAITILMVAISGPLTVAFQALTAASQARDQITASFLAQDVIEYVRNVKDSNIINASEKEKDEVWLNSLSGCVEGSMCAVDTVSGIKLEKCLDYNSTECDLYKDRITFGPGGFYTTYKGTNESTAFKRFMYLKPYTNSASESDPKSVQVVVDVIWNTGPYGQSSTTLRMDLYNLIK